jgi:O-antigen/teichoic acid export membrane protein
LSDELPKTVINVETVPLRRAAASQMMSSGVPDPRRGLGQATAVGAVWLLIQTVGTRAVGFVAQIVIASILFPEDFGLISLASAAASVGSALTALGFDQVILQRQRTLRLWVVPVFYLSLGLGIGGCLILLAAAPVCAALYGEPRVAGLICVIAFSIPLSALGLVPTVLLRSRLDFRRIATINFGEAVAVQTLTIVFAWTGFGAYSFALPMPIVAAGKSAALWLAAPARLRGSWHKVRRGRHLLANSVAVFLAGLLQTLVSNGDYIILGMIGTAAMTGNYFFAFKFASQPLLAVAASLSSVLLPALAHMRTEQRAQGAAAFKAAKLMGLVIMPLAVMQAAVAEPAIHLLFRGKWDDAIPLIQILSVALGFDSIAWVAVTLIFAQRGFWKHLAYVAILSPAFFICIIVGGLYGSVIGVAIGGAIYYVTLTPIYSYIIFRANGITVGQLASLYLIPAAGALLAAAGGSASFALLQVQSRVLQVAVTAGAGILYYIALLWIVDRASFLDLQALISRIIWPRSCTGSASTRANK